MRKDRILWLILALGAALRFWKIDGDLPYVFHYDEPTLIDNAVWMLQGGTLNPHFFNYPTGLIYLLAGLFGLLLFWGTVFGQFAGWKAAIAWISAYTYPRPPEGGVLYFYPTIGLPVLYLIGRFVSVLAGVGAVVILYAVARRAGGSVRLARLAALMLAISPLAVEHSHLITTDMTATMLATACLLAAMIAEGKGRSAWIKAGILGGLAAGVKYNAGLVVVVLALLALWKWRAGGAKRETTRNLALAAGAALAVFLVTTPFALLDLSRFVKDLGYEFHRVGSITASFRGAEAVEATPGEKLAGILWHNLGIFGLAAVFWGAVLAVRSRSYARIAVVVWVAVEVLPQLRWWSLYARYLLLAWPAVLLLAAWGIEDAARRAAGLFRQASSPIGLATAVLAVLVLVPGTAQLATREIRRARPDPRVSMTEWIEQNIPHGSRVVVEPAGAFPSNAHFTIDRVDFLGRSTPDEYLARGVRFLAASGREKLVEGKDPYRGVEENLRLIREDSDVPWSSGKYTIYFLRGENSWLGAVEEAMAKKDFAGARSVLEGVAKAGGGTPYLYKQLAEARLQMGDTTAAMQAYREVARRDTTDVDPYLALGDYALGRGDLNGSLRELEAARRIAPRAPIVFHNLAVTYLYRARERLRAGDRDGSRIDWQLAKESAAFCAKTAPGDSAMVRVLDQVLRMGRRWGFDSAGGR
jgi:4-amino-4-deoxy-L-arabinose transferase-like glycosyltransferase